MACIIELLIHLTCLHELFIHVACIIELLIHLTCLHELFIHVASISELLIHLTPTSLLLIQIREIDICPNIYFKTNRMICLPSEDCFIYWHQSSTIRVLIDYLLRAQ